MEIKTFKTMLLDLLEEDVIGLSPESKIKYMKKWIRDFELKQNGAHKVLEKQEGIKVGVLVKTTFNKLVNAHLLSDEMISLLQDEKYSKNTFDINFPFLKKVIWDTSFSEQTKIKGYNRYWKEDIIINGERFFVCSQWYERNKPRYIRWVKEVKSLSNKTTI
jgi:hypothetical protein